MEKLNFWDISWGDVEAKDDPFLEKYFLPVPRFNDVLKGKKRYIIGRKGTGKTAILKKIFLESESKENWFCNWVSLEDFPINDFNSFRDKSFSVEVQLIPIWRFLILVELCKFIIDDQSAQPGDIVADIKQFLNTNFPDGLSYDKTITTLKNSDSKLTVPLKWIGIETGQSKGSNVTSSIHFKKVADYLTELLKKINSDSSYYLLFDKLDEGYKDNQKNHHPLIISLLKAIQGLYNEFDSEDHPKFKLILALRDDIFSNLVFNDKNKLDDYILKLNWRSDEETESNFSIYKLINYRINASLKIPNFDLAWEYVSNNKSSNLPQYYRSLWHLILTYTHNRPRDVIKFMKICRELDKSGPLDYRHLRIIEKDYSEWFYGEFVDELHSHISCFKNVFDCLAESNSSTIKTKVILKEFENDSVIKSFLLNNSSYSSPIDILKVLYDFNIIGLKNHTINFKYIHDRMFRESEYIVVHNGLKAKFI